MTFSCLLVLKEIQYRFFWSRKKNNLRYQLSRLPLVYFSLPSGSSQFANLVRKTISNRIIRNRAFVALQKNDCNMMKTVFFFKCHT